MDLLRKEFRKDIRIGKRNLKLIVKLWETSKTIGITNKIRDKGWVFFADIDELDLKSVTRLCKLAHNFSPQIGDLFIIKTRADGLHWHVIGNGILRYKKLLVSVMEEIGLNQRYIGFGYANDRWTLRVTKKDKRTFKPYLEKILRGKRIARNYDIALISTTLTEFLKKRYPSPKWKRFPKTFIHMTDTPLEITEYDTINVQKDDSK